MYEYSAQLVRVVDGDTVWLDVDLGFDIKRRDSFRLFGINAPEMSTDAGKAAKAWLAKALPAQLTIRTEKDRREKFGRYLATLLVGEVDINQALIDAGHAVAYNP